MNNTKLDAAQVWKDFEDLLAPRLSLCSSDRVVYSHLFRHSRLEGKLQFSFVTPWLARGTGLCCQTARDALRRLNSQGVLDIIERSHHGYVVRLRLPQEVREVRTPKVLPSPPARLPLTPQSIEDTDFLQTTPLRCAIHQREGGQCFYCLRRVNRRTRCLDHVVPRVSAGGNSYRNLVSCCADCNMQKSNRSAEEHLRALYRDRRLGEAELNARLRALDDLAAGKLKPQMRTSSQGVKLPATLCMQLHSQ